MLRWELLIIAIHLSFADWIITQLTCVGLFLHAVGGGGGSASDCFTTNKAASGARVKRMDE